MLIYEEERLFRKDLKRVKKRGNNIDELKSIVRLLLRQMPLPRKNNDHDLIGNLKGFRECHIRPDWLLIYRIIEDRLIMVRTGSHSDLFK